MTATAEVRTLTSQWIGGEWTPSNAQQGIAVTDPSDETTIATVPAGTESDMRRAVAAATGAAESWAQTPVAQRLAFLERLLIGLDKHREDLAETITSEVGAPTMLARRLHVGMALGIAESFLDITRNFEFERRVGNSLVLREAAGVVGAITPWNVPLILALQKIVPALMAGCTVVHKPSELTPLHAYLLAEIIADADLPPGVFNMVVGDGLTAGAALAAHPDVDLLSFTGSVRAGREVARLASQHLAQVHLELGGKSASLVLDDADLDAAVRATVDQICFNTGQACLQWSRLLVPADRYDEALEIAAQTANNYRVGPPRAEDTDLGPLVSAAALERVRGYINTGIAEGARLVAGGPEPIEGLPAGHYVRPTVFGDVTEDMTLAREEVFGPVLSVMRYEDEQDAIRLANNTAYGLHGSVWSGDTDRAQRVARRIRTGQVDINGGPFNILAPFGGVKGSGYGRECGVEGLDGFCAVKSLQLPVGENAEPVGPRLRRAE